jgi:lysophospholipase L1-like esterase
MKPYLIIVLAFAVSTGCGGGASLVQQPTLAVNPPHGVVFIGDSITANQNLPAYYTESPLYNDGISGQTSMQIHQRFAAALDNHPDADTVVLECGTNDIFTGQYSADNTMAEIAAMVTIAGQKNKRIIVATVLPRQGAGIIGTDQQLAALIAALNVRIKAQAVEVVDYHKVLSDAQDQPLPGVLMDGIHPTDSGYKLMAPELVKVFNAPR